MTAAKTGALIPIRLASERLPGKALMNICGRPVVHHLLDRVVACRYVDVRNAVVCTTEEASDNALVGAVEAYGASVFRGHADDIIRRFHDAMLAFNFSAVVQVDGDDPLTETEYMDRTMAELLANPDLGIVSSQGLPFGINCKSFSWTAMRHVFAHYKEGANDTGFISFFTKTGLVEQGVVAPVSPDHIHDEARLTLDYEVDLEFFRHIFEALYVPGEIFSLAQVVAFLRDNPQALAINADLDEEYWQRWNEKARLGYRDANGHKRVI